MRIFPKNYATVIQNLPEYGTTLFFPNNFCSQSSRTGDSEYVSELFFLGNVLLNVLEFETENEKNIKKICKKKNFSACIKIYLMGTGILRPNLGLFQTEFS